MDKHAEDLFYRIGLAILGIFIITAILLKSGYTSKIHLPQSRCIFQVLLGMYCPGCGGTRAVRALLHGKILQSIWYHPLIFYGVICYLGFMVSYTAKQIYPKWKGIKFRSGYFYGALVVLGVNFIVKNALKLIWGICMI